MTWPGVGVTYAEGAYVTTELIAGSDSRGRWRGVRQRDGAAVIIAARFMRFSQHVVERFRYQGPGVAPLVFVGPPDGYVRPPDADHRWELLATIEQEPGGRTLDSLTGKLAIEDVLGIAWGMAEMVAAASASERVISGLRPEVSYATEGDRGWRFTGLCPMSYLFLGHGYDDGGSTPFMPDTYFAPEFLDDEVNQRADVFSLALVLWFLATGSHAYAAKPGAQDDYIHLDQRKPWSGPADVGALLESALWSDPARRASIDEFRARLHDVARAHGVRP